MQFDGSIEVFYGLRVVLEAKVNKPLIIIEASIGGVELNSLVNCLNGKVVLFKLKV